MVRGSHISRDPRTIGVTDRPPPAQVSSVGFPAKPTRGFDAVSFNGKTRSMSTQVPSGDCNLCHTQNGTAVGQIAAPPGRIALP